MSNECASQTANRFVEKQKKIKNVVPHSEASSSTQKNVDYNVWTIRKSVNTKNKFCFPSNNISINITKKSIVNSFPWFKQIKKHQFLSRKCNLKAIPNNLPCSMDKLPAVCH